MHMKKLKIHIEELGPIRNADIELAPIMIFTGASNLGKSYTNFLAYYVFYLFSSNRLLEFFQTKVKLVCNDKGKGRITIPFASEDELERLVALLDRLR